jgi:hypothetical protein
LTVPAEPGALAAHRSAIWSAVFRGSYRTIRVLDPLIRSWIANGLPGLGGTIELRTVGRRTGRPRRTLLTLLRVGEGWYVGHPNGEAAWMANGEAAGWVEVDPAGSRGARQRLVRLPPGPERDAVIRATWSQQPFPADVLYRAARRHVAAVGVYHRLEPAAGPDAAAQPLEGDR